MADYSDLVTKYSKKYGVPEKLIHQLISVESSGKADAVSPTGPVGLMQVSKAVANEAGYSKADMYDPEKNIDAGTRYLAQNLKAFKGNVPHALLGYNQGTGGARQMLSGKKEMAQEGWNYIHNKKFSPEYLAAGSAIPAPSSIPSPTSIVELGQQAMKKPEEPKYNSAAMMQTVPQQATPAPQPKPQTTPELSDADKINMFASQVRGLFNHASTYQNTAADTIQRGFMDQWMNEIPAMKNAPALFGGFK